MKKIVILFLLTISLTACKKQKKSFFKSGDVTINGKIENFSKMDSISEIELFSYDFLSYNWTETHKAKIDSDGNFSFKISVPHNQVVWFGYKETAHFFMAPNSTINIVFDAKPDKKEDFLKSLKFSGSLAKENQLMTKYELNSPMDYTNLYKAFNSKEATPKSIYYLIDSVYYKKQNEYINNFISKNNPPQDFINWISIEKEYKPIIDLLQYALFYFRPSNANTSFENNFPKEYLEKINNLPKLKNEDFVNENIYTTLPNYYGGYIDRVLRGKYKTNELKTLDSILYTKQIYTYKNNPVLFKILFFDELNNSLKNNNLAFYDSYKKTIDSTFKNTVYEKAIKEKYATAKNLIENPVLPKETELLTFSSNDATTFLDEIIKNANGKVIYIDNWATWCEPCKEQLKNYVPQFEKQFSKDVEFVYLCHLSDKKLYKPTIAQYKVKGKHYFITLKQNQELIKILNIKGYPSYTIINKKGEIVHSGFEYRPSEPITSKILKELIK